MSALEDALNFTSDADEQTGYRPRTSVPSGWEPGIDSEAAEIRMTSDKPEVEASDWAEFIRTLGYDPEKWTVFGESAEVRVYSHWMKDKAGSPLEVTDYYHKARIRRRHTVDLIDFESLVKEIRRRGPLKNATTYDSADTTGAWLVAVLTDWQAGKVTTKGGTALLADRIANLGWQIEQLVKEHKAAGRKLPNLLIALGGDMVENCTGHYASQAFLTDLDMGQQYRFVRNALKELIDRWAKVFKKITVLVCAGNHGEKRNGDGKVFTTSHDNYDLDIPEALQAMLAMNPDRYGHVSFIFPEPGNLTAKCEVGGLRVGLAHGHQFKKGGASTQQKALKWWTETAFRRLMDVDVLISGHWHHDEYHRGAAEDGSSLTWFQCPTLDSGSEYFEHGGGDFTYPGQATFVIENGDWDHWRILPAIDTPPDDSLEDA